MAQRDPQRMPDVDERARRRTADAGEGGSPGGDATVDEMSEASFPASDPPATWTWEGPATAAGADESHDPPH